MSSTTPGTASLPPSAVTRLRVPLRGPQAVQATTAMIWWPENDAGGPALVLAHGAGTDFTHSLLRGLARGLAARGLPIVTFNFGYAEAGRKRPDPPQRLESAYRDVLGAAREQLGPARPLFLGGRSMGGRMASHLAAQGEPCAGLVLLGYPLHPAGKPERLRSAHWPDIQVPVLFVQGDRDTLCKLDLFARERGQHMTAAPSTLHVLERADHAFAVRKRDGREAQAVIDEVVEVVGAWVNGIAPEGSQLGGKPAPGRR